MVNDNILKLFVPILKSKTTLTSKGKQNYAFKGILSDDSLDRDDEMMSPTLLKEWAKKGSIPGLINHDNKMESYVADFINLRTEQKGDKTILTGDIEFFPCPASDSVKLKLVHGRHMGLSVSAITHGTEMVKKEVRGTEKEIKMFTQGELLEGSFIPIQSNRNSQAFAIAKSFKINTQVEPKGSNEQIEEVQKMEDKKIEDNKPEIVIPEVKSEPKTEVKVEEKAFDLKKAFENLNKKFEDLKKELTKTEKPAEPVKEEAVVEKKQIDNDIEKVEKETLLTEGVKIVKTIQNDSLTSLINKNYGVNKQ